MARPLTLSLGFACILTTSALASLGGCSDDERSVGNQNTGGTSTGASSSTGGTTSGGAGGASTGGTNPTGGAASGGISGGGEGGGAAGETSTGGTSGVLDGPIERGGLLVLELGDTYFAVEPGFGARITSFQFSGTEMLAGPAADAANFGSTFWTSPQSDWGWPPPAAINDSAYTYSLEGNTIVLQSGAATVNGKQLTVTKRISPDFEREAIDIEYSINNTTSSAYSLAGWEVSRVPNGGLTFFENVDGDNEFTPGGSSALPVTHQNDVTWYDNGANPAATNSKVHADRDGGYMAHVANGILYLKIVDDVPLASQAPGEGDAEIFANGSGKYVEVENQGPYTSIAPGTSLTYKSTWLVRDVPDDVAVAVGSQSLVNFVESLL